ncbi:Flagellar protein FliT [Caballeronia fortuita]|uniref:Flagellar protein FliT n=1 Tax=Caballeronia fortuita TaxID=1777138 RepID=A0A158DZ37_9BURK|nr:flagellar protein FliT [Caballeronia fortuita]SAK99793.1 Flagellar protein FliT [Caballeronia fortuita]
MTQSNQADLLNTVWEMTQAIEASARSGDWIEAARITETRSPLLMSLQADQPASALDLIRRIQIADTAVVRAAHEHHAHLSSQYKRSMEGVNAANHYQRMGSGFALSRSGTASA